MSMDGLAVDVENAIVDGNFEGARQMLRQDGHELSGRQCERLFETLRNAEELANHS